VGVTLAILSFIFPFALILFIKKYFERIIAKDPALQSINSLFESLAPSFSGLSYHAYFMLRRLLFAITSIYLTKYPLFQVYVIIFSSLANCCYILRYMPFDTPSLNYQEFFNEFCIYLTTYPCLLFTEISWDYSGDTFKINQLKYDQGWIIVCIVILNIIVNMGIMIGVNIRTVYKLICSRQWCRKADKVKKQADEGETNKP
jgi:hypothetical protein